MTKYTAKYNNEEINVFRTTNDVNGNPRYIVHFLAIGLSEYKSSKETRNAGLKIYRGKNFGGGFVFQSYNINDDIKFIMETLSN